MISRNKREDLLKRVRECHGELEGDGLKAAVAARLEYSGSFGPRHLGAVLDVGAALRHPTYDCLTPCVLSLLLKEPPA